MRPTSIQRLNMSAGLRGIFDKLHPKVPLEDSQHKLLLDVLKSSFRKNLDEASQPVDPTPRIKPRPVTNAPSNLADAHLASILSLPMFAATPTTSFPPSTLSNFNTNPLNVYRDHIASGLVTVNLATATLARSFVLLSAELEAADSNVVNSRKLLHTLSIVFTGLQSQSLLTNALNSKAFLKELGQCIGIYRFPYTSRRETTKFLIYLLETYSLPTAPHPFTIPCRAWSFIICRTFCDGNPAYRSEQRIHSFMDFAKRWNIANGIKADMAAVMQPQLITDSGEVVYPFDIAKKKLWSMVLPKVDEQVDQEKEWGVVWEDLKKRKLRNEATLVEGRA